MNNNIGAILLLLLCSTLYAHNKHAIISTELTNITNKNIEQFRIDNDLLGLQLCAINANGAILNISAGYTSPKGNKPISNNDILRVGSITKNFIATQILMLNEANKLQLDQSIDRWFPQIKNSNSITVQMLLNQTSGIENYWNSFTAIMRTSFGKTWTTEELIEIISDLKPYADPGTTFYYSNSNYILLAAIIENIKNKPIHVCIEESIIKPLNLKNTHFLYDGLFVDQLITGYDDEYIPYPGYYKLDNENSAWSTFAHGAGAMASTTYDLCIFIKALYQNKLINQESLVLMQKFDPELQVTNNAIPVQTAYGLGLALFEINNYKFWGHMGGLMGFESIVLYCNELDLAIAVAGNLSICKVTEVVKLYVDIIH